MKSSETGHLATCVTEQ